MPTVSTVSTVSTSFKKLSASQLQLRREKINTDESVRDTEAGFKKISLSNTFQGFMILSSIPGCILAPHFFPSFSTFFQVSKKRFHPFPFGPHRLCRVCLVCLVCLVCMCALDSLPAGTDLCLPRQADNVTTLDPQPGHLGNVLGGHLECATWGMSKRKTPCSPRLPRLPPILSLYKSPKSDSLSNSELDTLDS